MKTIKFFLCLSVALICNKTQAGLQIPYLTNDVYTLHVWHLDEPLLIGGVTNINSADAVPTASITLENLGDPNPGTPPYNDTFLGQPSFPGLTNSMQTTDKYGMCYGGQFSDVSSFCNTNTGAFTFEALVNFANNPLALPNNMEIICGDQPGAIGVRGWQFRITTGGQMEFNLLGGNGSDNDWKANLPVGTVDTPVAGQWYDVACTFTGNNPTNGDTAYQLKFYWTLLDVNRTNADLLATFTMTRGLNGTTSSGAGTVQPALGIGGSGRKITTGGNGVANGEGLIGQVDEVRISSVARHSNEMAFVIGGSLNPPTNTVQPPTNVFIGYGRTLMMPTLAVGTPPLVYLWQFTNTTAGGYTNLPGQTANTLVISNITFPASGTYRLIVTNYYGSATSVVAQVTVGAAFDELFNTGVDAHGVTNIGGATDLHYTLIQSADTNHPGPSTIDWNMFAYPIASFNGNFSNPDGKSGWIGPQAATYTSPVGQYVYRITFLLDSVDMTKPMSLSGIWYENEIGNDILINGQSTSNSISSATSSNGKFSVPFVITNGFVQGTNTLDFVTTLSATVNGSYPESALRVDMSDPIIQMTGVGTALPAGLPVITNQPADQTVVDAVVAPGSVATFSVVALGRSPLSYQWWSDGAMVSGATSRTLQFTNPTAGAQGTNFFIVISNNSGSVTSRVAVLTLLDDAAQFVIQPTNTTVAPGQTATFTAGAIGYPPITYQWFTNGTLVPNATNTSFSFTATSGNNNATIVCYATNTVGVTTYVTNSLTATLTVRVPLNLTWAGVGGNSWDIGSSLNWTINNNSSQTVYTEADNVTFDNLGTAQSAVNLTTTLHPSSVTASATSSSTTYTLGGIGSIAGSATLTKNGASTLVIDTTNSYTGATTVSGGTLQIGDGTYTGKIGSGPVTNNAAIVVRPGTSGSVILSNSITGSGSLTVNGGTGSGVALSGPNSYSGGTTVSAGSLYARNPSALGTGSTLVNASSGAQLYVDVNVDINSNLLTLNGSGITNDGALRKGGAGITSFGGTITLGSETTIGVDGGATLNLTNASGINASINANLNLTGSGAGNVTGPLSLGSGNLTVVGGTWTVAPSNNYSGVTAINGGTLRITGAQSVGPVPASPNPSQITLGGGALEAANNITFNDGNIGITLAANSTIAVDTNATLTISNPISSSSGYNLTKSGPGRLVLNGATGLNGLLYLDTSSQTANDGMLVIANNAAIANLPTFLGPVIIFRSQNAGIGTLGLDGTLGSITIGLDISLSGRNAAAATPAIENLAGNNTISGNFTLVPGGAYILQSDSGTLTLSANWPYAVATNITSSRILTFKGTGAITMSGALQDGYNTLIGTNVPINVLKDGTGTLNLPVANTYSGTTIVSNGVLALTGTIGTNAATVAGGLLLVGNGTIAGPVTVLSAGAIEAGTINTIGTANLGSTLALSGNTIVKIYKSAGTRDQFSGQTSVTYGGMLTVTNLGGAITTNDTFVLFSPGTSASNFASIIGSPGTGLKYTFTNGVLGVAVGMATNRTNIWYNVSGNKLTLSWSGDHIGWILQAQTNSLSSGLSTNWQDVAGSDSSNTNIITINPANPTVFYRLRLP
jgi:autotransporter-associated beta strand protein